MPRRRLGMTNNRLVRLITALAGRHRSVMRKWIFIVLIAVELLTGASVAQNVVAPPPPTAQVIMRQSLSHWRRNLDAARNYTYQQREVEQELEKAGDVKKTEIKTSDVLMIYGEPYQKL